MKHSRCQRVCLSILLLFTVFPPCIYILYIYYYAMITFTYTQAGWHAQTEHKHARTHEIIQIDVYIYIIHWRDSCWIYAFDGISPHTHLCMCMNFVRTCLSDLCVSVGMGHVWIKGRFLWMCVVYVAYSSVVVYKLHKPSLFDISSQYFFSLVLLLTVLLLWYFFLFF